MFLIIDECPRVINYSSTLAYLSKIETHKRRNQAALYSRFDFPIFRIYTMRIKFNAFANNYYLKIKTFDISDQTKHVQKSPQTFYTNIHTMIIYRTRKSFHRRTIKKSVIISISIKVIINYYYKSIIDHRGIYERPTFERWVGII